MIMFTKLRRDILASADPNTSRVQTSGDSRVNHEVDSFTATDETIITTTEILADEEVGGKQLHIDTVLDPLGFSNKMFGMSGILQRNHILTTNPLIWYSVDSIGTVLNTNRFPSDLTSTDFLSSKLKNFYALKTDIEVTVKINPTPFIQGALAVVLHPPGAALTRLQAWTYYPHELINLPLVNNATISVPYFSELEAYRMSDVTWEVSLVVISPLMSAADISLEVNVFGRFVNPELMIPVAQSNNELEQQKTGLVTEVSGIAADVLESAGTALSAIPVVGSFIPPLTWATRTLNKVASYFGWCKPPNMEIIKMMAPIPGGRMCNAEGVDNSVVLGLAPDNTVNSDSSFTHIDEMDLSYLFERKYVTEVATFAVGEIFHTIDLTLNNDTTPTNLLNIFEHHRYMRVFEVHMIKTAFHTGRLLVQYDYNNSINSVADARLALTSVYSKIIDLSKQDRFTFSIPWMSVEPFSQRQPGRLVISTFNDIVAAETVAQSLDVIVYTAYRSVQLGYPRSTLPFLPMAQSGDCCGNGAPIPTDDLIPYTPMSMVEYTMGETVSNLRSLAKRFTMERYLTVSTDTVKPRELGKSTFSLINSMYYARAGGVRYKFLFPRETILTISFMSYSEKLTSIDSSATQIFTGTMNNVAEVTLPFYYSRRRSFDQYPWPELYLSLTDLTGIATTGIVEIYNAAGDDYNGMFPLGLAPDIEVTSGEFYGLSTSGTNLPFLGRISLNGELFDSSPTGTGAVCILGPDNGIIIQCSNADGEWIQTTWPLAESTPQITTNSINMSEVDLEVPQVSGAEKVTEFLAKGTLAIDSIYIDTGSAPGAYVRAFVDLTLDQSTLTVYSSTLYTTWFLVDDPKTGLIFDTTTNTWVGFSLLSNITVNDLINSRSYTIIPNEYSTTQSFAYASMLAPDIGVFAPTKTTFATSFLATASSESNGALTSSEKYAVMGELNSQAYFFFIAYDADRSFWMQYWYNGLYRPITTVSEEYDGVAYPGGVFVDPVIIYPD